MLLERDREVLELDRLLRDIGDVGRTALVHGPAGIGKSTLLRGAVARARKRGVRVLSARGSDGEQDVPFGVVRQLLAGPVEDASPEERESLLRGAGQHAIPVLTDVASSAEEAAVRHGLTWVISRLAPALVVVDDVQWADPASVRFLGVLSRRLDDVPILLALGVRTGAPPDEALGALLATPEAVVFEPSPLSDQAVATLLEDRGVPAGRTADVCDASGGVPFLVEQLARELRRTPSTPVADLRLTGVSGSVQQRLARQPASTRRFAEVAAVAGDRTLVVDVAGVAEIEADEASGCLGRLVADGLLRDADPVAWEHPLVREAALRSVDGAVRARIHQRLAARLLEQGRGRDAASHLLETAPRGDAAVIEALRGAARAAAVGGDARGAVRLLARALREPPPAAERAALVGELGRAQLRAGDDAGIATLQEALELTPDGEDRVTVARDLVRALAYAGRRSEAERLVDRVVRDAPADDTPLVLAGELAAAALTLERFVPPAVTERDGIAVADLAGATPGERLLLLTHAIGGCVGGRSGAEVRELVLRAWSGGALLDDPDVGAMGANTACLVLAVAEDYDDADVVIDATVEHGRRRGDLPRLVLALCYRSLVARRRGRLAAALEDAEAALGLTGVGGTSGMAPLALGYVVDALAILGRDEDADAALTAAGFGGTIDEGDALLSGLAAARGRLRLAQGRLDDAWVDLQQAARAEAHGIGFFDFWRAPAAEVARRRGDVGMASVLAQDELAFAEVWGTPRVLGVARAAVALAGPADDREAGLRAAATCLEEADAAVDLATALVELGAEQRRRRDLSGAREPLARALDLAHRSGAVAIAARAETELRATGAQPRRAALRGPDALTPSERRVAELAAGGASNPEIAQELFVTRKTVEKHLAAVYRKLDVAGRSELDDALRSGDGVAA